jgi:hypothetical protein
MVMARVQFGTYLSDLLHQFWLNSQIGFVWGGDAVWENGSRR